MPEDGKKTLSKGTVPEEGIPTLADVARVAGVSTATVSRCLNSPDRVVERTREKVMAAVRDLGYAPNFNARALAAKRTNTFGAIIPTMENAIFARGLQAFQEELGRHSITLLVASSSYRQDLEEEQVRALIARGADALLLIGHNRTPETYDLLERRNIPYVISWVHDVSMPRPSIGFDNRAAMRALTNEVLRLGHRQIAVITADRAGNDRAKERYEGICEAVAVVGLDPAVLHTVETPYGIGTGAKAFQSLMQITPRPTAVLCGNDVLAAGALTAARDLGIDIPGEVSITGFDDIEIARIVTPALTTVHVPHREMGRRAAQALLGLCNGDAMEESIELSADVVWRETLGQVAPHAAL